jgi:hypothetical protein
LIPTRFQQPENASSITTPDTTASTTTAAPTNTSNEKLDRSDSHDSLQSYVNVKENTSASTTPELLQQPGAGWGGYLSSWIKKPDPKKQD